MMDVVKEVEHEDGSATYTFEMTEEERKIMVSQGILWSLVAGITGITPEGIMEQHKDDE